MSGKSFMNDDGESYGGIVQTKQPNKGDGSPAEVVEAQWAPRGPPFRRAADDEVGGA